MPEVAPGRSPYPPPRPAFAVGPPPPPPSRRWRGWRVAGLVAGIVALLVAAGATALAVHSDKPSLRAANGAIVHAGQLHPSDLRVGDCLRITLDEPADVHSVPVLPCAQLHNAQVFTVVQGSGAFPGISALQTQAADQCKDDALDYLAIAPDTDTAPPYLHVVVFVPEKAGWTEGRRGMQCVLVDREKQITGDIRDDH
jgi:hypothetical protein